MDLVSRTSVLISLEWFLSQLGRCVFLLSIDPVTMQIPPNLLLPFPWTFCSTSVAASRCGEQFWLEPKWRNPNKVAIFVST